MKAGLYYVAELHIDSDKKVLMDSQLGLGQHYK